METTFTADELKGLLAEREPPCVSLYMPTHRRKTEARPDAILFRNLSRSVEKILSRDVQGSVSRELLDRLSAYDREDLWDDGHPSDGLCVFVAKGFQAAYRLPGRFPELEVVGSTFHTKPLIRYLQGNSLSYFLLALNMRRVALYEGMADSIREVPLREGIPVSFGDRGGEKGGEAASRQAGGSRRNYGQGETREHARTEQEKFFRLVARDLWKRHLRLSPKSLILAAPAQHQALFRKVAQIPTLLADGIVCDPSRLNADELRVEARRILEPAIASRVARATDEFGLAVSRGHGTDSLRDVASLVAAGRVKVLFVESGRRIWGVFDPQTGQICPGDEAKNAYDVDLLDELAELALVRGGEVFVLGKDDMPASSGIAAIKRY